MTAHWKRIADCLREELAEYGGLLNLFEAQQRALSDRNPHTVVRHGNAINAIARSLARSRLRRDKAVEAFAVEHGRPATSTLRSLLPLIDADARPLLEALMDETNHLLRRVRRASRKNHSLLTGAADLQQETLQLLRPSAFKRSYGMRHGVAVANSHPGIKLRAAG